MNVASIREIQESLSVFDIDAKDDALDKMLEISILFQMDADAIVDEWLAYQSTHGCNLNKDNVEKLLLEKTIKNKTKNNQTPSSNRRRGNLSLDRSMDPSMGLGEDDLLSAYGTPKPRKSTSQVRTPYSAKKEAALTPSNMSSYSPSAFSPSSQQSQKYGSRTNSGDVVVKFGPSSEAISTYRGRRTAVSISMDDKLKIKSQYHYMFQKLGDLSDVMDEIIEVISEDIKSNHPEEIGEFQPCSKVSQEPIFITGRVCCDQGGGVGRLNSQSVLLQGGKYVSEGRSVCVDLSQVEEYSLFPGQIVVLLGTNPSGKKFIPTKVFTSTPKLPSSSVALKSDPLSLLVASGPFTTSDCLSYEPLQDLIRVVKERSPDVTIIIGPIADNKHDEINTVKFGVSYEDVIADRLNYIIDSLRGSTSLVFVPSSRDAGCHAVYPRAPYVSALPSKDVYFAQDPCVLDIEGVSVALTSNDVLFHLCAEEISKSSSGPSDRIGRLAQHLIQQRSFYPLCPSNESLNVDYNAVERYGFLAKHPDVLILPSDLKSFVKLLEDCVCVNPGRLAKGTSGGTYAQILIEPEDGGGNICNGFSAQVVRI